jgi:putative transposase
VIDITFVSYSHDYDSKMDSQRTFFITTVTWQRRPIFRNEVRAQLLLDVFFHYQLQGKYFWHEFVIMPDHLHMLLTPALGISLERAVQFIKGGFSYRLGKTLKMAVWQQSFTNHRIRDGSDYVRHREYIHSNPVRAGLVEKEEDYPYSSVHFRDRLDKTWKSGPFRVVFCLRGDLRGAEATALPRTLSSVL